MHGIFKNGLLQVARSRKDGYKPMNMVEPPTVEGGYEALFYWKETETNFTQQWEIVPISNEVDDSEALEILLGGAS